MYQPFGQKLFLFMVYNKFDQMESLSPIRVKILTNLGGIVILEATRSKSGNSEFYVKNCHECTNKTLSIRAFVA